MSQRKPFNIHARLASMQLHEQEEMSKEKAIKILEDATKQANAFCIERVSTEGVQNDKTATSAMFLLGSQAEPAIDFLTDYMETNPSEKLQLKKLISELQERMAAAVQRIEEMRTHNDNLAKRINIAAQLNELAKKPDTPALRKFIRDFDRQMKLEYLSHALRYAAATGQANNIDALVKSGGEILGEGPTSKQIPMHHAIINGQVLAVHRLLRSVNAMDYFDPVGQLQKPDSSQKTPLDYLNGLSDLKLKNAIREEILTALNTVPNNAYDDSKARAAICEKLAKPFQAEVAVQQSTQATSSVKCLAKK